MRNITYENGVGITNKELPQSDLNAFPYNNRKMMTQMRAHSINIIILQIYASTSKNQDDSPVCSIPTWTAQ